MKVEICTSSDAHSSGDQEKSPSTGLTSSALPETANPQKEEKHQVGVSTKYALSETNQKPKINHPEAHWYALRTTYGREKKAYDYLVSKGVKAFCPTLHVTKEVKGERRVVVESRLPNIFFAHGTEEELKQFVYDNVNLPFLRFYYRHFHQGSKIQKAPLIVPDYQIESLRIRSQRCAAGTGKRTEVQERAAGKGDRRQVQGGGRKSGTISWPAASGRHHRRHRHHRHSLST